MILMLDTQDIMMGLRSFLKDQGSYLTFNVINYLLGGLGRFSIALFTVNFSHLHHNII